MLKLIILVLVLAIGFGGGIWFATKNPELAAKISAEEERRVIQAQIALNKKLQAKLESMQKSSGKTPGSGFLGGGQGGGDAELAELKAEAAKQEAEAQALLAKMK